MNLYFGPDIFSLNRLLSRFNRPYLYVTFAPFVCQFNHLVSIADDKWSSNDVGVVSGGGLLHNSPASAFQLLLFPLFLLVIGFLLRRRIHILWVEVVLVLVYVHLSVAKLSIHGYYTFKVSELDTQNYNVRASHSDTRSRHRDISKQTNK